MTGETARRSLGRLWMEKARRSLETARRVLAAGDLDFAANRLYYAAFYAVSALLAERGTSYGKHTAVRAALHRDFVRAGVLSPEWGELYDHLF